jgi:hypothetical protein
MEGSIALDGNGSRVSGDARRSLYRQEADGHLTLPVERQLNNKERVITSNQEVPF